MSLWTVLCALVRSHVGTGRGNPQTVSTLEQGSQVLNAGMSEISLALLQIRLVVFLATAKPRLVHQIGR